MAIKKTIDEKLKVKALFLNLEHEGPNPENAQDLDANSAYEGPCRLGTGEQLTHSFDQKSGAEKFKVFKKTLETYPDFVEFVNPQYTYWTDAFNYKHELYDELKDELNECDLLVSEGVLNYYPTLQLAKKSGITSAAYGCCSTDYPAGARLEGMEAYAYIDHEDAKRHMGLLRAKKALKKTRVLYVLKDTVLPFGSQSNIDPGVLNRGNPNLGVDVRFVNWQELLNVCENLTDEEKKIANDKAKELIANAKTCSMTEENVTKSCYLWVGVKRLLEKYGCNAFTMPCHEVCATRAFNDRLQFTPCLCHSLLKEEGIPSACELDLNALLSIDLLMNLTGSAPHMGNSGPFFLPDKLDFSVPNGLPIVPEVQGVENIYYTFHAVQTRKMRGINEPMQEYQINSFTHAGWGATISHDFDEDRGEKITMVRFSPDAKKMLVIRGEIVAGAGRDDIGCGIGFYWKCADSRDAFEKQSDFGHHLTWVYGDYSKELKEIGKMLNVEVVLA